MEALALSIMVTFMLEQSVMMDEEYQLQWQNVKLWTQMSCCSMKQVDKKSYIVMCPQTKQVSITVTLLHWHLMKKIKYSDLTYSCETIIFKRSL